MRGTILVVSIAAVFCLLFAGCKKQKEGPAAGEQEKAAAAEPAAKPEPAPKAAEPTAAEPKKEEPKQEEPKKEAAGLTPEKLREASQMADRNMTTPWKEAWENVTGHIGEPMKTDGKKHYWFVMEGEKCLELRLEDLGSLAQPTFIGLSELESGSAQFEECKKAATGS